MDAQFVEMAKLPELLAAKNSIIMQLLAKHGELTNKVNLVKTQHASGATVSDDLSPVARAYTRHSQHASMARLCKESLTTPPTASLLSLLAEKDNRENYCEALTLESQCIPGLSPRQTSCERLEVREKTDSSPNSCGGKPITAANKVLVALEVETAVSEAAHAQLVDVSARYASDAAKAGADPESCQVRPIKV